MSKEVNSKAIYLKSMKRWVPVSDEYYDIHRREIDAYIHRMRNHGCCRCPKSRWWLCDEDCWNCEFRCGEEYISLETPCGENTEDISLGDSIADGCSDLQSIIEDRELLCKLFDALKNIDPKRSEICRMWANGMSERDIADKLGYKSRNSVFKYRKQGLKELKEILKNYI